MATTEVGGDPPTRNVESGLDGRVEGDDSECPVEQCPQCQQEVANKSMEDHFQEDCSHQEVPCELKHAGCNFKGPRYQMLQHMESNMPHHFSLISNFIKEEKERCSKELKNLKNLTIGIVVVGVIMLGGFLYFNRRLQLQVSELAPSIEKSVTKNIGNMLQKMYD